MWPMRSIARSSENSDRGNQETDLKQTGGARPKLRPFPAVDPKRLTGLELTKRGKRRPSDQPKPEAPLGARTVLLKGRKLGGNEGHGCRSQTRPFSRPRRARGDCLCRAHHPARSRGPARARSRAQSRAGRRLRRSRRHHPLLPRTGDRHRHGQERPYRHEGRGHAVLHRHAGVLRASERGKPRRPRHDHPRRRDPRLLLVGRNRRARQSRVLFAPLRGAADRRHLECRKHARQGGRSGAGAFRKARKPARMGSRQPPPP